MFRGSQCSFTMCRLLFWSSHTYKNPSWKLEISQLAKIARMWACTFSQCPLERPLSAGHFYMSGRVVIIQAQVQLTLPHAGAQQMDQDLAGSNPSTRTGGPDPRLGLSTAMLRDPILGSGPVGLVPISRLNTGTGECQKERSYRGRGKLPEVSSPLWWQKYIYTACILNKLIFK